MQIFFSPFSPFVRKCLIAADVLGVDVKLLDSNAHPVNRSQELIALNPLGKVPTFYAANGDVVYDSRVICEYLNETANGDLFPKDATRWSVLTLAALGDGMLEALLLARYEDVARPDAMKWADWKAAQLDKMETSLQYLERLLGQGGLQQIDIGVITVACALWYADLRFPEYGWRNRFPALGAWFDGFAPDHAFKKSWSL
jgi:glutathione S-transferase